METASACVTCEQAGAPAWSSIPCERQPQAPSQQRHWQSWGSTTPASSRSASMLVPSLSFLLCFFSWVIYFSERKECGEFTTGLAFIFFFSAAQQPLLYEGSSRHRWQSGGGRGSWLTVGLRGSGYITTQRLKADPAVHVAQGRASKLPGSWEMLPGSLHANWTPGKPAVIFSPSAVSSLLLALDHGGRSGPDYL